jgi:hypothetical protein
MTKTRLTQKREKLKVLLCPEKNVWTRIEILSTIYKRDLGKRGRFEATRKVLATRLFGGL